MMNCKEATRLMSDAQERKLNLKEKLNLRFHVMMCAGCRYFGEKMKNLSDLSRRFTKGNDGQL